MVAGSPNLDDGPRPDKVGRRWALTGLLQQLAGLLHEGRGRVVDLLDETLNLLAGYWPDFKISFGGLGEEIFVLHGLAEGAAQRVGALLRYAGRRQERPSHHLPSEDHLEDRALLVGAREVHDQRYLGQVGML